MAVNFAENLEYVHGRGVIRGDVSVRNFLVFDDLHINLCDFAGSRLKNTFPELLFSYEPRYWAAGPEEDAPAKGTLAIELFALGTAICEITKWTVPYGSFEVRKLQQKLLDREYSHVTVSNPVRGIF